MVDVRVPIDSLEYTRQGLRTRDPIVLQVGENNRVILVRPERVRPVGDGRGGFSHDSSFPLPATLSIFWEFKTPRSVFRHLPHGRTLPARGRVFQLYAHASESGDDDYNKGLTERRAAIAKSLLRADVEAFKAELAASGYESLKYHQFMLRVLGCDPGPIDDEPGDLTEEATAMFQRRYAAGDFHRHTRAQLQNREPFPEPGVLDDITIAALVEAFVVANGAHVEETALHPTHPARGCSEFNRLADEPFAQRRLTLLARESLPQYSELAPCTPEASACAVVDDESYRCLYYREHVHGRKDVFAPRFFDPRWLALPNGHFFLSALTTLPDDAAITFRIYDTVDGIELGSTLSAELSGIVKLGVAMVVWAPEGSVPGKPPPATHRPAFRVADDQRRAEATKPWPLTCAAHVLIDSTTNALDDLDLRFRLRATNGTYEQERHVSEAVPFSTHHVQLEFTDVPIESRFILEYDEAGGADFDSIYFEDVVLAGLRGQCEAGSQCTEPELPEPPSQPSPKPSEPNFDEEDYEDAGDALSPGDDGYGMEWDPEA